MPVHMLVPAVVVTGRIVRAVVVMVVLGHGSG